MKEEFYPIVGNEDTLISRSGQVISRYGKHLKHMKCNGTGYLRVKIRGKRKNIHRLLAIMFIPNPNNYPMVNHIDGNKVNNSLDNLEWCTGDQNMKHAQRTGLLVHGRQVHTNVLDETQVKTIFYCTEVSNKDLAAYFKVHPSTVYLIRKGINWKHLKLVA
jgi:hypothetical protein